MTKQTRSLLTGLAAFYAIGACICVLTWNLIDFLDELMPPAHAQQQRALTTITGGTISATNTYQALLARDDSRRGCLFQNQSAANKMFIFAGTTAAAQSVGVVAGSGAIQVVSGGSFNCVVGNMIVTDQLVVAGTMGDGFVVWNQ